MTRPTTTGKAQDLITFTRSTTGTALAKISYGEELVTNGDFSSDSDWAGTNWSIIDESLNHAGTSFNVVFPSSSAGFVSGKLYTITLTKTGVGSIYFYYDGSPNFLNFSGVGTFTQTFIAGSNSSFFIGTSGDNYKIDNISVKEVLYDQPDGTLQLFNHPINKPRIEYDAEGNCLGLLVEEGRTNLVTYSEALFYASNRAIAESSVSPTGEQTAQTWRVNGSASGSPYNYGSANIVSGTTYTCSVFVRLPTSGPTVEPRYVKMSSQTTMQGGAAIFDLQEGTVVSSNMASESITPVGNGWYRISVTNIATSSGGSFSFILWSIINAAGALYEVSASDDGKALFETFGMQTEAGSFPTSYIPTSGSTVTRSADVASLAVSKFGYNQGQGSVVVEAKRFGTSNQFPRIAQFNDGSASNRIGVSIYGSSNTAYGSCDSGGVNQASLNKAVATGPDVYAKIGFGFGVNNFGLIVDSIIEGTDTSGSPPSNITQMQIGTRASGQYLNGYIKSIQYYPLRLSNAQLQALTI